MKKFAIKPIAVATFAVAAGAASAGTIVSPTATGATPYAVEALSATTNLTLPSVVYRMGVARTTAQDFTVILTPSAGSVFTAGSCAAATPTKTAGGGTVVATQKRASATECAYEVDVTADTNTATELTFAGLVLDSHTLNVSGSSAAITIALKDLGETAFIDNVGSLTRVVATSGNALTLTASPDTATKADVNDEAGPLFGFVTVGDDANAVAKASFIVGNNSGTTVFLLPDGSTPWDFTADGTEINVTVTGSFQGLATGGFLASTGLGTAPVATVAGSTATFTLLPTNIGPVLTDTTVTTTFTSARTASLGTSRVFGVSAVGDVLTGADVALSGNSTWWTWGANATQLMSPYMSTNAQYVTRFSILNTGAVDVGYTVQCYTEGSSTATNGAAGTLKAAGTTVIPAADVCSFSGAPRGAVVFTINAPSNAVKGVYNIVDAATGANGFVPMTRPYTAGATSE